MDLEAMAKEIMEKVGSDGPYGTEKFALFTLERMGISPEDVINIAYNMQNRISDGRKEGMMALAFKNIAIIVNALDLSDDEIEAYLKDYLKQSEYFLKKSSLPPKKHNA
jgi:hypothetical protein